MTFFFFIGSIPHTIQLGHMLIILGHTLYESHTKYTGQTRWTQENPPVKMGEWNMQSKGTYDGRTQVSADQSHHFT